VKWHAQALAFGLIASVLLAGLASADVVQKGTVRVNVSGKLKPKRLPRTGSAPIAVSVGGKISSTDATLPPQLKAIRIELNRNGLLDDAGLPICPYPKIQPGSSARALAGCRSALVGEGAFSAEVTLASQVPYPTQGKLLLFNGERNHRPVLYGHIYSPKPFATSFVIVFELSQRRRGPYGSELSARLPRAMGAWGRLTSLSMTLSRRYRVGGERRSYLSAGCPLPEGFTIVSFPLARTSFDFVGGQRLTSVLVSTCKAR
jgi:hypothetical protein